MLLFIRFCFESVLPWDTTGTVSFVVPWLELLRILSSALRHVHGEIAE